MSRHHEFLQGARDMLPMLLGAIPFGIIFGSLAGAAGLSPWQTVGMSLLVFAGSAQFIAISLLGGGATLAVLWLTTFVVNLRHALYSASLQPYVRHLPKRWRMPLVDPLSDALAVAARDMLKGVIALEAPGERYLDAEVLAEPQTLVWNDRDVPCLVIEFKGEDLTARTWVRASDGLVLCQEARGHGDHLVLHRYSHD